jgi:SpoVK/Ycf46/Vps4 family AAA+-type ATPase
VIEAIGRCVVWLDEIEKAMAGAASGGAADGGVSADALGAWLNWMQERRGEAFVLATSNDVSNLPPEMLRKGRFDEVWWVDLPNSRERAEIVRAALREHGRGDVKVADYLVAEATDGFTGAEIAALVPDALYSAFADNGREINTADLVAAASVIVPLSKTAAEKIAAQRAWASGRARPATSGEVATAAKRKDRVLDI